VSLTACSYLMNTNVVKKTLFRALLVASAFSVSSLYSASPEVLKEVPEADLVKIREAAPVEPAARPRVQRKVLVMWLCKGYFHESIPWMNEAIRIMGEKTGAYSADFTDDPGKFTDSNLRQYDAIIFNNTTLLDRTENEVMRRAIINFANQGGGVVGLHAATDNFYKWPEVAELMGGAFDGHPWGAKGTWRIENSDPMHPMNRVFDGNSFDINDELYQLKDPYNREKQRILLSVDVHSPMNTNVKGKKRKDDDYGLSWVRQFGPGRLYYSGFGHNKHVAWDARILKTWLDGIQFAVGDLKIPTDPVAKADAATLFIALRDGNFGVMGRRDLCRRLEPMVMPKHIPALSSMLPDPEISHYIRKIIENTPCEASEIALIEALKVVSPELKPGMISSLGVLRSEKAVDAIRPYLSSENWKTAQTAMRALGNIPSADAARALFAAEPVKETLQMERDFALLECAAGLMQAGYSVEAERVFNDMIGSPFVHIKIAAYQGLAQLKPESASVLIAQMNESFEPKVQQAGAVLIADLPVEALREFASELGEFGEPVQLTILGAIQLKGDRSFGPGVASLLDASNPDLKLAAIRAMGTVGDATYLSQLMPIASEGKDFENAVVSAISLMSDSQIDAELIELVRSDSEESILALECLGRRDVSSEAMSVFIESVVSEKSSIARKAGSAIIANADLDDLTALCEAVRAAPDSFASKVLVKVLSDQTFADADAAVALHGLAIQVLAQDRQRSAVVKQLVKYLVPSASELLEQLQSDAALADAASAALADLKAAMSGPPVLTSSHGKDDLKNLFNDNPKDRWSTGAKMKPGMWLQIEQSYPQAINSIALDNSAGSRKDFPRDFEVYVSSDGQTWGDPVLQGKGSNPITNIEIGGRAEKYIRIVCTSADDHFFWSIHDIKINNRSIVR